MFKSVLVALSNISVLIKDNWVSVLKLVQPFEFDII